jgi:hypothetical protein
LQIILLRFTIDKITIRAGEYDFNDNAAGTEDITLESMTMHEEYNSQTFDNDIAMLKLSKPVTLGNSIYPICLPKAGDNFDNRRSFVIGRRGEATVGIRFR